MEETRNSATIPIHSQIPDRTRTSTSRVNYIAQFIIIVVLLPTELLPEEQHDQQTIDTKDELVTQNLCPNVSSVFGTESYVPRPAQGFPPSTALTRGLRPPPICSVRYGIIKYSLDSRGAVPPVYVLVQYTPRVEVPPV